MLVASSNGVKRWTKESSPNRDRNGFRHGWTWQLIPVHRGALTRDAVVCRWIRSRQLSMKPTEGSATEAALRRRLSPARVFSSHVLIQPAELERRPTDARCKIVVRDDRKPALWKAEHPHLASTCTCSHVSKRGAVSFSRVKRVSKNAASDASMSEVDP